MKKTTFFSNHFLMPVFLILLLGCLLAGCGSSPTETTATTAPIPEKWLPVLHLETASATGATVVFRQEHDIGNNLVLCGNDYFLEQYTGSGWQPLPTLTEDPTFVTNAFVIMAIPREDIDWQWLYGTLSPGHYRLGKTVTLHSNTENRETDTVYAEFTIKAQEAPAVPSETSSQAYTYEPEAPLYTYAPLESIGEHYSPEAAAADHVVILTDSSGTQNQEVWHAFASRTAAGETGTVRCLNVDTQKNQQTLYDVAYDGVHYNLRWFENGEEKVFSFKHLLRYQGDLYLDPNAQDRYVLTMDPDVTWEDIQWGMVSQNPNDAVAHKVVYQELRCHPVTAPIPDSSTVTLSLRGNNLITVTGSQAEALSALFASAEAMEYRPEVYYMGLDLIFYGKGGAEVTVWLDLYGDHFLYDGTFYQYSTDAMFEILEITTWPEEVLFAYPEAP